MTEHYADTFHMQFGTDSGETRTVNTLIFLKKFFNTHPFDQID